MDTFAYRLLSHIKLVFEESCGVVPYERESAEASISARQFYTRELADNLIRPMKEQHRNEFAQGSGEELKDKMRALRSSSAMTFNVLGNEAFMVRESHASHDGTFLPGSYRVAYEYQLPTLRRGAPANLDALLTDGNRAIACEMKFLEWVFNTPKAFRDAYHRCEAYRHDEAAGTFMPVAKQLEARGFVRYDYAQMFKHALALYNACAEGGLPGVTTLTLLNVVWEPPQHSSILTGDDLNWLAEASTQERREFEWFAEEMQPVGELLERLGVCFTIAYMPVSQLIALGKYPIEEQGKLRRYIE